MSSSIGLEISGRVEVADGHVSVMGVRKLLAGVMEICDVKHAPWAR